MVRPDAEFFTASVTKLFIVALLLQAHERGEVALDASISRYLPAGMARGLHVLRDVDRTEQVTVRHLASHASGLPDYFERRAGGPSIRDAMLAGRDETWGLDDVIASIRTRQRPHFPPRDLAARGATARYSDTGFQLLIRILEQACGRGFGALLAERIARPLGLASTRPAGGVGAVAPLPVYSGGRRIDVPGLMASSNDLVSTSADLIAFGRALRRGEVFDDPRTARLLTERTRRLRGLPMRYGLGTMVFRLGRTMTAGRPPLTLVGHSGVSGTWLFWCPELGLTLAGTVDQVRGQGIPFRLMARLLHEWRS